MKVRAIYESGRTRVVLEPENKAEGYLLASMGEQLVASAAIQWDDTGYRNGGALKAVAVTIEPAPPAAPPAPGEGA